MATTTNARPTRERLARNQSEQCGVPGCFKPRHWTHQYCDVHRQNVKRYGNPTITSKVLKRDLKPYRVAVCAVMRANEAHPGQRAAIEKMTSILDPGPEPWSRNKVGPQADRRHRWEDCARLKLHKVTAAEALEVVCATWYLAMEQPARFPDQQSIAFAISRSLLTMAPLAIWRSYYSPTLGKPIQSKRMLTAGSMRLLGTAIMENLVSFATQVRLACEATRTTERAALSNMRQPLAPGKPRRKNTKRASALPPPLPPPTPSRSTPRRDEGPIPEVPLDFIN